jgi:peroxiredoxin
LMQRTRSGFVDRTRLIVLLALVLAVGCAAPTPVPEPTLGPEYIVPTPPGWTGSANPVQRRAPTATPEPTPPENPQIGAVAPDFVLTDLNGDEVELRDFRGHVVLLNFWATWCPPCRLEIPMFVEVYEELKDQGFVIVAVNMREGRDKVAEFVDENEMSFPVLLDPTVEVGRRYLAYSIPRNIVIDRDGIVRQIVTGMMREAQLLEAVRELL